MIPLICPPLLVLSIGHPVAPPRSLHSLSQLAHPHRQQLLPSGVPCGCQLKTTYDDTKNVTGPPQPPLLMVHGTNDLTVPYINGKEVADRASSVGLTNRLITIPGAGHVPFGELWASTNFTHQFFSFLADNFAKGAECPV